MTFSSSGICTRSTRFYRPFLGHGVGPTAMEDTEVEVLLGRQMPHTGHKRPPQRPIIDPSGKDFVDGRVMNGWFADVVLWYE